MPQLTRNCDWRVRFALRMVSVWCAVARLARTVRCGRLGHGSLSGGLAAAVLICFTWCHSLARAGVEPPLAPLDTPIVVSAEHATHWTEGQYEVWLLGGNCQIQQDQIRARCRDAVLWIDRGDTAHGVPSKIIAYLETDVAIDFAAQQATMQDRFWLGRFHTLAPIELRVPQTMPTPVGPPPVVQRGLEARHWEQRQLVQPAQFVAPTPTTSPSSTRPVIEIGRITVFPRSSVFPGLESIPVPDPNPNETILAISPGVRVVIRGIENVPQIASGTVTLEADRVIVWTDALSRFGTENADQPNTEDRLEVYLEGNIVYREGDRVIYADRMYYDVNQNQGVILNAEALTPVPDYQGLVRLKADVLRQLDAQTFVAYGAALTSSRLGVPRYWFQSQSITFQDNQQTTINPYTGQAAIDADTRELAVEHDYLATSRNNFLYLGGYPILYWPFMATDLSKPTFYLDRIRVKNDSIFGTQAMLDWDLYQLFGIDGPAGSDWTLSTDYLSERGFGLGTHFSYDSENLFRLPGRYRGFVDAWGLDDRGLDNLGFTRRAVIPEKELRGRILARHRHQLPAGFQFTAELGLRSDRTFLEQYYGQEWDELKDQTTGIELKRYDQNSSWSITADTRLNDSVTETEWLPRFDHFLLGQSMLQDRLTWHAHSQVGYAKLQVADAPLAINPEELANFSVLPWEAPREGIHAATRQEVDWPFQLGPVKVVPYLMGEVLHVGESIGGAELTRAWGQAGVRTSLPIWAANPAIQDQLFNLNGLAHKVVFDAELLLADAEEDLRSFPLYEPLDDDNIERYRRRLAAAAAGTVPAIYDPRLLALRQGMQSWVTAPSTVVADDLTRVRLGLRQRWQTKRGLPGRERIVDWIVLDVEGSLFPEPDRDNFGEEFGLFNYDFRWHIGDRLTLLSDGFADVFAGGLRTFTAGGVITRPLRGQLYLGFRTIEGPISTNILSSELSYRMTQKWVLSGSASIALDNDGNVGQSLSLTRIGESFLVRAGVSFDESRDNVGVILAIEPRFLASSQLGRIGGAQIPPAGLLGLE